MFLIAGLGNPGDKYKDTRHNIGFIVIDKILKSLTYTTINKPQFRGELFKNKDFLLLKPQTFMNLSGESVVAVKNYYKIDDLIVIHDDLDLSFGAIKFKRGGGSGGHNGLKSIDKHYGNDYIRVRLGIGKPTNQEVHNYVLSNFSQEEKKCLEKIINQAKEATLQLTKTPLEKVSSLYSFKKSICNENI